MGTLIILIILYFISCIDPEFFLESIQWVKDI